MAAGAEQGQRPVTVIIDAKRGLVYCGMYKFKNGRLKMAAPYALLNEKELLGAIKDNSVILGNAINLYREKIMHRVKGAVILDKDYWYPKAHKMITLALERIKDKKISNAFNIRPTYLYPKECQIKTGKK
ncbi:MAG: hypothetical protein H8D90_00395 [Candidatus Omnitrophica bacterium]|nr:hypothetical protein [Candidatus Omnitrophota bacterium]